MSVIVYMRYAEIGCLYLLDEECTCVCVFRLTSLELAGCLNTRLRGSDASALVRPSLSGLGSWGVSLTM